MFDRILVIHGLEGADAVRPVMRQLWRVLAPEGRMLIVAPNRTSLWSQIERSPFAHGRPFHRGELDRLLRASMFEPVRWDSALYGPPLNGRRIVRTGTGWEKIGRNLWPATWRRASRRGDEVDLCAGSGTEEKKDRAHPCARLMHAASRIRHMQARLASRTSPYFVDYSAFLKKP